MRTSLVSGRSERTAACGDPLYRQIRLMLSPGWSAQERETSADPQLQFPSVLQGVSRAGGQGAAKMTNWTEDDLPAKGFRKRTVPEIPQPLPAKRSAGGPPGGVDERLPPGRANRSKYGAIRTSAPASWGGDRIAHSKAGAELSRSLAAKSAGGSRSTSGSRRTRFQIGVDEQGRISRYRRRRDGAPWLC